MKQQELEKSKEYKYCFTTDIESVRAPIGLNEEVIRFISIIKIYIMIMVGRLNQQSK